MVGWSKAYDDHRKFGNMIWVKAQQTQARQILQTVVPDNNLATPTFEWRFQLLLK